MNKKLLSFALAASMITGFLQTAVFADSPSRAEALRTVIQIYRERKRSTFGNFRKSIY